MKKIKIKKLIRLVSAAALCAALLMGCPAWWEKEGDTVFASAPSLSLESESGSIRYYWSSSKPSAESYDVYYREGQFTTAAAVKQGTQIANAVNGELIDGLDSSKTYSVTVRAKKKGYTSVDSPVQQAQPESNSTILPPITLKPSSKRGVGYNFQSNTAAEMDLLMPKTNSVQTGGITWFYNWGTESGTTVGNAAKTRDLAYVPMSWNSNTDIEGKLRSYLTAHPECKYLLAYNEPNLTDQANMSPIEAAQKWSVLKQIAQDFNLKLVSPAMNFGTLNDGRGDYSDPVKWLDEFFTKPGVSINDISAISIHSYMPWPTAFIWFVSMFKKYNKPIWVTEFCAWEGWPAEQASAKGQMEFMSQVVTYMELEPAVGRYAWFEPKASNTNSFPYYSLLTTGTPTLTDCGKVYVNMSACDRSLYYPAGQRIEAEHFAACNIPENPANESIPYLGCVNFRPTTDTAKSSNIDLDIYDFTTNKWVEYQVDLTENRTYTLSLHNIAPQAANVDVYIDGTKKTSVSLSQTSTWTTITAAIQMDQGRHVIRLVSTSGNCALNWLKVE